LRLDEEFAERLCLLASIQGECPDPVFAHCGHSASQEIGSVSGIRIGEKEKLSSCGQCSLMTGPRLTEPPFRES
jgi:hypothetical protein